MIRVMAVDGEPLVLEGLRAALGADPEFEVVGTAASAAEAILLARNEAPDVAIVDVRLSRGSGVDLLGGLRRASPRTECVALTASDDPLMAGQAIQEGARGYLLNGVSCDELRCAVRRVASGHTYIDPSVREYLVSDSWGKRVDSPGLTPRERQVLSLAAQGLTNQAIGVRLKVGSETVKTHLSRAFARLGARDRANAVAIAMRREII